MWRSAANLTPFSCVCANARALVLCALLYRAAQAKTNQLAQLSFLCLAFSSPHAWIPFRPLVRSAAALAENNRLDHSVDVVNAFGQLMAATRGEVAATVTAAQVGTHWVCVLFFF